MWEAKFWAGDSATGSIVRAQESQSISCTAPVFDDFVAISYEDLNKLENDVLSKCEKWSDTPAFLEAKRAK